MLLTIGALLLGLLLLIKGADWLVHGASSMAKKLGIPALVIGLTVVAFGTSLPELATSAVAAYRGQADLAVGNVVGSNIFNIFFVLGVTTLLHPLVFQPTICFDILVTAGAGALLFLAMFIGKRYVLERWQGWGFVGTYAAYLVVIGLRG